MAFGSSFPEATELARELMLRVSLSPLPELVEGARERDRVLVREESEFNRRRALRKNKVP